MEIQLNAATHAVVEELVASGRFASADEAIAAGIKMLASAEKLRSEIQKGIDQADRGHLLDHDTVFARLKSLITSDSDT